MRIRFTIRRAMLAVAVVAVAAGPCYRWVSLMRQRSQAYQSDALYHELNRKLAEIMEESHGASGDNDRRIASKKAEAWHANRRDIYKEAANRPWMTPPPAGDQPSEEF